MNVDIRRVGSGILVRYNGVRYGLDKIPRKAGVDYTLITHAHIDHLPYRPNGRVLATEYTLRLAELRGYRYSNPLHELKDVEMIDSGHILGSTAFLIGGKILYTGDVNNLDRLFLKGFRPPKADILIIESTYGDPGYIFGDFNQQVSRLIRFISRNLVRGTNVVLRMHPLGKPQLITYLLRRIENLYVTPRIAKYNEVYRDAFKGYVAKARVWGSEEPQQPFIVLASTRDEVDGLNNMDVVETRISGFMIKSRSGVALSDHSDYDGLMKIVDAVDPKKVYTVYGYSKRFADALKEYGYDAEPLG